MQPCNKHMTSNLRLALATPVPSYKKHAYNVMSYAVK